MRFPVMLMRRLYRGGCARTEDGTIHRMRTLLIRGADPVPAPVRELIDRGSTSVELRQLAQVPERMPDKFDRIVFWAAGHDSALQAIARRYAEREAAERREVIVFITPDAGGAAAVPALAANEVYVWPRDKDRLEMAFLTGA